MSWYQFDPSDVEDDPSFIRLDPPSFALAVLLVFRELRRGPLLDDPRMFAALWGSRFVGHDFDTLYQNAKSCFDVTRDGALYVPWVENARAETENRLRSDRARQKRKRDSEREARVCHGGRHAGRHGGRHGKTGQDMTGQDKDTPTVPLGEGEAVSKSPIQPPKKRQGKVASLHPDHAPFIAWWCDRYEAVHGAPYAFAGAKDGAAVSWLLKQGGVEEAKARASRLLSGALPYLRGGLDLGTLRACWNKLAPPPRVVSAAPAANVAVNVTEARLARERAQREQTP